MIDAPAEHLETVRRILAAHVPGCEIRAFGSRVTGAPKNYSDLDLAIVGRQPLNPDVMRGLKEALEESDLPFRVDVLDWNAIAESFQKVIERRFEILGTSTKNVPPPGESEPASTEVRTPD